MNDLKYIMNTWDADVEHFELPKSISPQKFLPNIYNP